MNRLILMAVLAFSAGCAPKFLVSDYFIPDTSKVVRTTISQSGLSNGEAATINYFMQVCDLQDGKATNCKKTMILSNVLTVADTARGGF